ncbi:hypothetical protein GCM10010909_23160 [Acidocella aquatica]|uniref:DUF4131 domain-containing protein n=1 Tax=Acidocella aquatica TaxID=1922313 RepID=A0ABQ6A8J7_9PROT|nr:hypothetical protein [Acidocella aquatica]GLR67635.1 hypothetical protein GCM10010909_23160 [Acidocella aquatica]
MSNRNPFISLSTEGVVGLFFSLLTYLIPLTWPWHVFCVLLTCAIGVDVVRRMPLKNNLRVVFQVLIVAAVIGLNFEPIYSKIFPSAPVPSIGSLEYVSATIKFVRKLSTGDDYVQMQVQLKNENPYLIQYSATLSGSANGKTPQQKQVVLKGYVAANSRIFLIYNDIYNVKLNGNGEFMPAFVGILKYNVKYRSVMETDFVRSTGKTLRFISPFGSAEIYKPMNEIFPIVVRFDSEIEK